MDAMTTQVVIWMARKRKNEVLLIDEDVKTLKSKIRSKNTSKMIRSRCQIILDMDCAHGKSYTYEQCARANGVCMTTVTNTLKKYAHGGLEEILKYNRNINSDNARRKVDGRTEAKIITIACSPAPEGRARWTLRLLEDECRVALETPVGKDAIRRALKKTNFDLT